MRLTKEQIKERNYLIYGFYLIDGVAASVLAKEYNLTTRMINKIIKKFKEERL